MYLRHAFLVLALLTVTTISSAQPDTLWTRTFGGSLHEICAVVQQTTDSGYILGGSTESFGAGLRDFWLVKTDANGDSLWSRTFGGSDNERCSSVQQTTDGGYVLAGDTYSFGAGQGDFWLVKTDANGDSLWSRTFGESDDEECYSVQQTSDGGYVLAGYTEDLYLYSTDFWLVKTDVNGDTLWSRTFGGNGDESWQLGIQQTADRGYVLAGRTSSFGAGGYDFWLVKTDADGDSLWSRTFGGSGNDYGRRPQQTADGGYVLAGPTASFGAGEYDFWLVKTDANGDSLWSRTFGGTNSDWCNSLQVTADGGYVLAGNTYSFGAGLSDFWLVKTEPDIQHVDDRFTPLPTSISLSTYPNPFNPTTTISYDMPVRALVKVDIYNILGKHITTLLNQVKNPGTHHLTWDALDSPSGIYFVQLTTSTHTQTIKTVLLK